MYVILTWSHAFKAMIITVVAANRFNVPSTGFLFENRVRNKMTIMGAVTILIKPDTVLFKRTASVLLQYFKIYFCTIEKEITWYFLE